MCPATVLCIDDEAIGLQARRLVLEQAGFCVFTALDGLQGLSLFAKVKIDAVLLDYLMPGMHGGKVAAALRGIRPCIPILLHTACVDVPKETLDIVNGTLTKGDGPEALILRLRELLDASHMQEGA